MSWWRYSWQKFTPQFKMSWAHSNAGSLPVKIWLASKWTYFWKKMKVSISRAPSFGFLIIKILKTWWLRTVLVLWRRSSRAQCCRANFKIWRRRLNRRRRVFIMRRKWDCSCTKISPSTITKRNGLKRKSSFKTKWNFCSLFRQQTKELSRRSMMLPLIPFESISIRRSSKWNWMEFPNYQSTLNSNKWSN